MKLRQIMTDRVIRIHPEESVAVAARMLTQYNVGALPVCDSEGRLRGLVTDRDIVVRCLAAGMDPAATPIRSVMTTGLVCAEGNMSTADAAQLMARRQIRRLPVVEGTVLRGMVSLADLAGHPETAWDAADALEGISSNVR